MKRTYKADRKRRWDRIDWINRCRDVQSQRYLKNADSAFLANFDQP